jgi:hypothetical protein
MSKRTLLLLLTLSVAFSPAVFIPANRDGEAPRRGEEKEGQPIKIRLKLGKRTLTATLTDSETTRDFVSLLPLNLTMNDLFGREKFAHLPRAISVRGERRRSYEVGDVVYWSPGPDVAIYYRHDGESIPSPGVILIGTLDSGTDALNVAGSVRVTIELMI